MPNTRTLLGGPQLALGPCSIFWDSATGGADSDLGGFESLILRYSNEKTDLIEAQGGTGAQDKVVTAVVCQIELGLSRATAERLADVVQGIKIEKDSAGNVIRLTAASLIGQRDSDIWKQLTVYDWVSGKQSTDPLDIFDFWLGAPMGNLELTFDAATQRFAGTLFECYKSPNHLDADGLETFFKSREVV